MHNNQFDGPCLPSDLILPKQMWLFPLKELKGDGSSVASNQFQFVPEWIHLFLNCFVQLIRTDTNLPIKLNEQYG